MLSVLVAWCIVLGTVHSISTFGEEKQCFRDNVFGTCKSECDDKLPADKAEALKACFLGDGNPMARLGQCLSDNGIRDDKPCFKRPVDSNSGFRGGMPQGMGGGGNRMQMMRVLMSMKDFLMCMKDCAQRQATQCTEGCAEVDDATSEVFKTCASQEMQSHQMQCLMNAAGQK